MNAIDTLFAAGDVVRWPNVLLGHEMRVEHWTNAAEQGAHAASNLLAVASGEPLQPYAPVPFFWSDQFEHRIQFLGHAMPGDEVRVVAGSIEEGKFLALYGARRPAARRPRCERPALGDADPPPVARRRALGGGARRRRASVVSL